MLERFCYLIEKLNTPLRARNNAYLRGYRANQKLSYNKRGLVELSNLQIFKLNTKKAKSMIEYKKARIEANLIGKEISAELKTLRKQLKVRLQRMSNCPIIQNIYWKHQYLQGNYKHLNGKKIREHAMMYMVDNILLGE